MGLGKTSIAIAVAIKSSSKTLIVCPAYLQQTWQEEINKFVENPKVKIIKSVEEYEKDIDFYIVSYTSILKSHYIFEHIDMVICDECTALKNHKAKRSKNFEKYILEHKPKRLLLLSGTPIKNSVKEWHNLLRLIWHGGKYPEFNDFGIKSKSHRKSSDIGWYAFINTFCNKDSSFWGTKWTGYKKENLPYLSKLLRPVYIRKRASQVLDLPKIVNKTIKIGKKSKLDKKLKEAWDNWRKNNKDLAHATIKAESALKKTDSTIELAKEIASQGEKVIIFTDHIESAKRLSAELKASLIMGSTPTDQRQLRIDNFNSNSANFLVGTIGAMSTGFTINSACHMIFNDISWVPADLMQAKKRNHRIGQTRTCFYYYILLSDIDYQIFQTVLEKTKEISGVINV